MLLSKSKKYFLFKEEKMHKWQKFIWLTFLENKMENLQYHKIKIPYDCEFIVIRPKNETTTLLTEIYEVKNRSFSLDFGTWDINGLKIPNASFYARRSNFENTKIEVACYDKFEV